MKRRPRNNKKDISTTWLVLGGIVILAFVVYLSAYVTLIAGIIGLVLYLVKKKKDKNLADKSKLVKPLYKQWWLYCLILSPFLFATVKPAPFNNDSSKVAQTSSKKSSHTKTKILIIKN